MLLKKSGIFQVHTVGILRASEFHDFSVYPEFLAMQGLAPDDMEVSLFGGNSGGARVRLAGKIMKARETGSFKE